MMRYFYDEEFIDNGSTIDLISIGIVAEDGRELYLQSCEFDSWRASAWVKEHVFPHLALCPHVYERGERSLGTDLVVHQEGQCTFSSPEKGIIGAQTDCLWRTRNQIALEIRAFCNPEKYDRPELWGYYSAYDHVAFCQLFGSMIELPDGFPMYTRDLKQWCDMLGSPQLPAQGKGEHNALADARWNKEVYTFLKEYESAKA